VPPFSLGGSDDYDISPNGQEVCYSMNAAPMQATSTDSDLYVVSMAGGPGVKITITMGADSNPRYSPDGKYIAWRGQQRAGYESDRWRLMTMERSNGKVTNLTETLTVGSAASPGRPIPAASSYHLRPRPASYQVIPPPAAPPGSWPAAMVNSATCN
jgi:dipeptidyl aminopeptidase/acylaminoacyl peptidase